jgi:hypothetical protein
MTFDLRTAYAADWRWTDDVDDYSFQPPEGDPVPVKVQWTDLTKTGAMLAAGQLGLSQEAKMATLWNPTLDETFRDEHDPVIPAYIPINPKEGDRLTNDSGGWIIDRVIESRFGSWLIGAKPERVNVPA